jgi:hypothetical protein
MKRLSKAIDSIAKRSEEAMSMITDHNEERVAKQAHELLDLFSTFPPHYLHGPADPYLRWLRSLDRLPVEHIIQFFNSWRPLSRHQPQLLLLLASAFDDPIIQKLVIKGNAEEEGGWNEGHDPHWVLLDRLIEKLGGQPVVVAASEEIMNRFERGLRRPMTKWSAAGYLAGIENPALDISAYFREIVRCSGFTDLVEEDLYISIHVRVEPTHVVDSHELALRYMAEGPQARTEMLESFAEVMSFWSQFWSVAFSDLQQLPHAS